MASGNRVEELESRVRDLEATVDGLTDELVECKVRIRELESVVDAEIGLDGVTTGNESEDRTGSAEGSAASASDEAEATKSEPPQSEDNTESEESDIIIA